MNKSKNTIRGPEKKKKARKPINPKIWIITSIVLAVLLIVAILFDQLYERVVMTVDGEDYRMSELSYYFYNVESQYDYINQLYGGQYWDMAVNETGNITVRDLAKDEAIRFALDNEVLYREAKAAGYTLTDEEKDKVSSSVTSLLNEQNLSDKMIELNGFTEDYLTDIFSRITLAERYRQDVIDSLDIDDESIKAGIKYEDYRQYDIEYVFISTEAKDSEGKTVPVEGNVKKGIYDKIKAKYDAALNTEDWSTLVPEDETDLKYRETNFLANSTTYSDAFKEKVTAMENGAISDVFEDEKGYYFVRMINNNSSESYDSAVENAIRKAEDEAFQTKYSEDILTKHTYKLNANALRPLRMGTITLKK